MADIARLLVRLRELLDDSTDYFVSGSLSFLPLLGNYRAPRHDVDIAVARELFSRFRPLLRADETIHTLTLAEVAVAGSSPLARWLSPRTGFIHVDTPDGLLDFSCYRRRGGSYVFSFGAGISLELPGSIRDRCRALAWEGIEYMAGPMELAFLPKALWLLQSEAVPQRAPRPDDSTMEDLRRLQSAADWAFVEELLTRSRLLWMGREVPGWMRRRLDPFAALPILSLQNRVLR